VSIIDEDLGHEDVRTTMIYLHFAKPQDKPMRNPLDILRENSRGKETG